MSLNISHTGAPDDYDEMDIMSKVSNAYRKHVADTLQTQFHWLFNRNPNSRRISAAIPRPAVSNGYKSEDITQIGANDNYIAEKRSRRKSAISLRATSDSMSHVSTNMKTGAGETDDDEGEIFQRNASGSPI